MMVMLTYPHDFVAAQGLNQLWTKDTSAIAVIACHSGFAARQALLIKKPRSKGTFSFTVPLRHIFGFCVDYDKVIWDYKHTLPAVRASESNAIFRDNAVTKREVRLDEIAWFILNVKPSLQAKNEQLKVINNDITRLETVFRDRIREKQSVSQSTNFSWKLDN